MPIQRKAVFQIFLLAALFFVTDFFAHSGLTLNALDLMPASRLLKLADEPTVYYVNQKGLKLPIPSAEVFLSYDAKWEDIEIVSAEELNFYLAAEYIKLIGDAKVYQLKNGVKRYLTQSAASTLKIFPEEVIPVNKTEFSAYESGETLGEAEAIALREEKDAAKLLASQSQVCVPDENAGGENGCTIFKAVQTRDTSQCGEITDEKWKAKCLASVIPESGDATTNCESIVNVELKNECLSQIAGAKNDASLCSQIADENQKQFCLTGISFISKNLTACDNLPEGDGEKEKNSCLFAYAGVNTDSRACDKISTTSVYKQACGDILSQKLSQIESNHKKFLTDGSVNLLSFIFAKKAEAQFAGIGDIPVGGRFLPGLYDIFTPTPYPPCLLVSVVGPAPGVFNFIPISIYDYFIYTPNHIGLNMLGLSKITPPCPPTLYMLGSSLAPY